MGERGTKPQGKVAIKWSPNFAYAIGLITTDGNLSSDGRHVSFVSKDKEQISNFIKCLRLTNNIGGHNSGNINPAFRVQFGDVLFYNFLLLIGLTPHKSKTLHSITVPDEYFFDFLRGHFDGDGTFYSYWDPRWKSSFMFYTEFLSASKIHIQWLQAKLQSFLGIHGHTTKSVNDSTYHLKYAKADSLKLLPKLYYDKGIVCLSRKRRKIEKTLKVIGKEL
jgi:hypothetical protein